MSRRVQVRLSGAAREELTDSWGEAHGYGRGSARWDTVRVGRGTLYVTTMTQADAADLLRHMTGMDYQRDSARLARALEESRNG